MENRRVATASKAMFIGIMLILGMMVGTLDASFPQCIVRCARTCIFDPTCVAKCGVNCLISDPPDFGGDSVAITSRLSKNNYNNFKFCNLGCLATAIVTNNPSSAILEAMSAREAEEKAEQMVYGCSSACSKNFQLN